jgi:hypothetical protein
LVEAALEGSFTTSAGELNFTTESVTGAAIAGTVLLTSRGFVKAEDLAAPDGNVLTVLAAALPDITAAVPGLVAAAVPELADFQELCTI